MVAAAPVRRLARSLVPAGLRWPLRVWAGRARHAGDRRWCPCCESRVRAFRPFGEPQRRDAQCPVCGALERDRLATLFLRQHPGLLDGLARLLHVAPERPLQRMLCRWPSLAYVTADIAADGTMVRADLTRLPFPDGGFDAVYCSHVLEHVPDDRAAMRELCRVLRPGGWAILQVPVYRERTDEDVTLADPAERRRRFGQPDHVRVYGHDFADRLAEAGFQVSVVRPQGGLDAATVERCGLKPREDIHFCLRPA